MDGLQFDKSQLLDALHHEYGRLQATLARLTEPNVVGWWSIKDVIAHLVYWNRFPVQEIQAALDGRPFQHPHDADEDAENAAAVALYRDRSLDDVLADFSQSFQEVVQLVERLPERAFEPGGEVEGRLGDTIADTLNSNTYDHYALHRAQIDAWINAQV